MTHKIGYVANRSAVPSIAMQRQALLEYGVDDHALYEGKENLDHALASLREGDELVVYTTAIFGRNKLNDTFIAAIAAGASAVYSTNAKRSYTLAKGQGVQVLADAWKELDECQKNLMGAIGRQLGGRKPGTVWGSASDIRAQFDDGVSKKALAEGYKTSFSTITRILEQNQ